MTQAIRLELGEKAPTFKLPDQNEKIHSIKDYLGGWVILYFYPKDDTPGCTTQACDFTSNLKQFENLNATILGVSKDSAASHTKFIAKQNLKITLLSDEDNKVMEKYGTWGIKKLYGKEYVGVIRSSFLIDPKGNIAHTWYAAKATGHVERVKEKLKELAG